MAVPERARNSPLTDFQWMEDTIMTQRESQREPDVIGLKVGAPKTLFSNPPPTSWCALTRTSPPRAEH